MKKAIVTGPTGAIGTALIRQLVDNNVEVYAICRRFSNRVDKIVNSSLVHIIRCDLKELDQLPELMDERGFDVFYHLGWDGTFGDSRNNVEGQLNNVAYTIAAVEAAHRLECKKFVGAGSQAEYGNVDGILTAQTPTFPTNCYGMAKLFAGQVSRVRCNQLDIEHVWTRVLSVYGPNDGKNTMVMSTIAKLLTNEAPQLTKGEQTWDYLYEKDAGKAFFLIGEKGISGKTYCLGSGTSRPLYEYMNLIWHETGVETPLLLGAIPYQPNQVMHLSADISELSKDTGFVPCYSFEAGIKETIDSVRQFMETRSTSI